MPSKTKSRFHPKLAVIGDPISHSLSPVLQNFLMQHFDLPFTYEAVGVAAQNLPAFVEKIRAGEFAGANVTIPHKQAVIPLLDDLVATARRIGAVNTIVPVSELLLGHNTDVPGFLRALQVDGIAIAQQDVLVLGAGGSARAVLHALLESGASTIYLCNRDLSRAEQLCAAFAEEAGEKLRVIPWEDREDWLSMRPVTIIVNATSAGMPPQENVSPLPASVVHAGLTVIDLIYRPAETLLLRHAQKAGAKILNGLPMLIYQGVAALELWSGQKLELGETYPKIEKRLLAHLTVRSGGGFE